MPSSPLISKELKAFSQNFDTQYENSAASARGEFLRSFPLSSLKNLKLDKYVIGLGKGTFCYGVEVQTKSWANVTGSTSAKFGIYYGKTNSDSKMQYRSNVKFGRNTADAFEKVKTSLLELLTDGEKLNFKAIDDNPLSQMFKAKILSLYFPGKYLNVCSADHLAQISSELGLEEGLLSSEYQHRLLKVKDSNGDTKTWSNPKFMSFLYQKYIYETLGSSLQSRIAKPRKVTRRKVDFKELQRIWDELGKKSEEFAIGWERDRLAGLGYDSLIGKIKDRRDYPSYGYDFLSFTAAHIERFIEVKSLRYDRKEKCYRFFLSENEYAVANSTVSNGEYYFYLVKYGKDGEPCELIAEKAETVFAESELLPCTYIVLTTLS
jgi:hypothetical protein